MSDINHRGYQSRLEQLKRILQQYNLQVSNITPVAYQELGPCPYNNFIYKIELSKPAESSVFRGPDQISNPCTTPPSDGALVYILRMSNPEAMGINPRASRIENEVAAMFLARKGLDNFQAGLGDLVPSIYAFCSKPSLPGDLPWALVEYKVGVPLDEFFDSQSEVRRESIIEQVSDVISGLQNCPLPPGVDSYGGLGVAKDGIISAEMTITRGGPWSTYEMLLKARLEHELHDADMSPVIKGWQENGVRQRLQSLIDKFKLSVPEQKALVHGDLTMNNMLINPETSKLTALLDFDFASIAHPVHEFLVSLQDLGCNIMGPYGEDPTNGKLSQALLSGNFSADIPGDLWWNGRTLNADLVKRGMQRPSDMVGIEVLFQWRALEQLICPFHLAAPFIIHRLTDEQREEARKKAESELIDQMEVLDKSISAVL
ncbi:hypothetical protein ASPZODRAFT_20876 [Penicilliopsis zonata CBS 506.65]|uniref:Aminoglycoside phosphotransferase domain-containing protein n=1 Tax=Penicilliopsis zonata CBS 506.65 TaxID=1073090 RepID=A0A1L9S4D9_9EURO|nr:hypothetical protein ASPZODRAFT_20876 [Penicilliopsis zonata CBS 506.65]OJJ42009.1 hypothetical protein ASPZODRAFT_20876 [Penicilliopsis zonata CBS 506.65]